MGTHVLSVRDLHAGYGDLEVLHGVSFEVPAATTVALLGPNGAGKTTLLGAVAGSVTSSAGSVVLNGVGISRLSASQRARRGVLLVPEGRGVFPGLSVADNLALAADAARGVTSLWKRDQLARVRDLFPVLSSRSSQLAGSLSGGEQQMLALSRALLGSPRLLMLDELSMGLAPQVVAQLFDVVSALASAGTAIVLVEQYLTYALQVADVCYLLAKGTIAFVGEPQELSGASFL